MTGEGRTEVTSAGGSRHARVTGGILVALAVASSLALLPWLNKPVFPDERVSLRAARLSWTALAQHSRVIDLVLLPYYSLLHLWLQVFGGIEWARFLSLVAFGLTVLLVGRLGVRLAGGVWAECWPRPWWRLLPCRSPPR